MKNRKKALEILENMNKIIEGKEEAVEKVMVCLLARGHLLIEDVPGVGKTTLAKALSKSIKLSHGRIQFTPDLMPSDITGATFYRKEKEEFYFLKGPIFHQILLADEINRTSPKTQSSLLQAMEEGQISAEGATYEMPKPFMVLATQNPMGYQGTFPLPEAQLDRFLMRISIGYPDEKSEAKIIREYKTKKTLSEIESVANEEDILAIQDEVDQVIATDEIYQYIVNIVHATRKSQEIQLGASPRAGIDLFRGAQALAYLRGRRYILPDDVKELLSPVLGHRLTLSPEARIEGRKCEDVIKQALKHIYVPVVKQSEA